MSVLKKLLNFGRYKPPGNLPPQSSPYAFSFYAQPDVPNDLRLTPQQQISVRTVYACARIIARSIGRAPWKIYTRNVKGSRVELPDDAASYLLNVRPNRNVPAAAFREALIVQAIVHGNAYAEIVYDGAGRIKELVVIPSERVQPRMATGGEELETTPPRLAEKGEVVYRIMAQSEEVGVYLAPEQVFHLRGLATVDGIVGDSVVTRAAKSIANAFAIEKYSLNYYANNTLVGGVIEYAQILKPEEQARLEQQLLSSKTGVRNAFKTLFLGAGAKFQPLNHDAAKAQVIEARNQSVEDIAAYFGVPLHMLGVSSTGIQGNGKNLNEHGLVFVRDALKPWAVALQQEADFKLFTQRAPWRTTEIDLSEFTRGDELDRANAAKVWIESGVKTINEVREAEGMNHIEGDQAEEGDVHLIGSGLVVLDLDDLSKDPGEESEAPGATQEGPEAEGQGAAMAREPGPSERDAGGEEREGQGS